MSLLNNFLKRSERFRATALAGVLAWIGFATGCDTSSSANYRLRAFKEVQPVVVAAPVRAKPTTRPANPRAVDPNTPVDPYFDWKSEIGDVIAPAGGLIASLNIPDQVYSITVPRSDLLVQIDGMNVPVAAGLASTFHFYRCTCGKMSVLGEFILLDYEANDVIDALRVGAAIRITAVGPIAIGDRPHLLSVRFHGEGDAMPLAKLIKEAMRWTGEERLKPVK